MARPPAGGGRNIRRARLALRDRRHGRPARRPAAGAPGRAAPFAVRRAKGLKSVVPVRNTCVAWRVGSWRVTLCLQFLLDGAIRIPEFQLTTETLSFALSLGP